MGWIGRANGKIEDIYMTQNPKALDVILRIVTQ